MTSFTPISPRPLTDAERARIERAHRRIAQAEEQARETIRQATAERDGEIAAAVRSGASQTDIAKALGITRQAVFIAIRRASDYARPSGSGRRPRGAGTPGHRS